MILITNPHFRQFNSIEKRLPPVGENSGPGCQMFMLCEIHCYFCPHIFWVYYFSLSQCDVRVCTCFLSSSEQEHCVEKRVWKSEAEGQDHFKTKLLKSVPPQQSRIGPESYKIL